MTAVFLVMQGMEIEKAFCESVQILNAVMFYSFSKFLI